MVPVENLTYVVLARSFLAADQPDKLYQFLHHNISSDSTELADLLMQHGKIHHSLLQLGLDMHFRLGAITPLVLALMDCGEVDRAIAISWRNMRLNSYDASVISATHFYNSMIDSSCATSSKALGISEGVGSRKC
uniref:Mic1 domain-containing protein n=1 Tax=Globisporangium ultimum (strain ATCC 200006 / CBS 805.95 / DAOM BR144) TaxID=431595 RepID=K3X8P6_GLOUD